jgi:hypothetical protein
MTIARRSIQSTLRAGMLHVTAPDRRRARTTACVHFDRPKRGSVSTTRACCRGCSRLNSADRSGRVPLDPTTSRFSQGAPCLAGMAITEKGDGRSGLTLARCQMLRRPDKDRGIRGARGRAHSASDLRRKSRADVFSRTSVSGSHTAEQVFVYNWRRPRYQDFASGTSVDTGASRT